MKKERSIAKHNAVAASYILNNTPFLCTFQRIPWHYILRSKERKRPQHSPSLSVCGSVIADLYARAVRNIGRRNYLITKTQG
jgi:hypothetical protein